MAPPQWARISSAAVIAQIKAHATQPQPLNEPHRDLYLIHISAYPASGDEADDLYNNAFLYMNRPHAGAGAGAGAMTKRDLNSIHRANLKWRYINEQTQDYLCVVPMTEAEASFERTRIVGELTAFAGRLGLHRLPHGRGKKSQLVLNQGFMLNILMSKAFAYDSVGVREFSRWARNNGAEGPRVLNEDDDLETVNDSDYESVASAASSSAAPAAAPANQEDEVIENVTQDFAKMNSKDSNKKI